jgi:hypothetical protein
MRLEQQSILLQMAVVCVFLCENYKFSLFRKSLTNVSSSMITKVIKILAVRSQHLTS